MNDKLKPAAIAGVICGIVAALPYVDAMCCAFVAGGGVLGAHLYFKNLPAGPNRYGPGASVGLLAGVVAAVADTVVSAIQAAAGWKAAAAAEIIDMLGEFGIEVTPDMHDMLTGMGEFSVSMVVFTLVFNLVSYAIVSAIGGLVGAAIFAKKEE